MNKLFFLLCLMCFVQCIVAQDISEDKLMKAQLMSNEGYMKLQNGDVEEAETLFLNALKLDKRVRETYMNLYGIYKENNPKAAIGVMERAASVFFDDDEVWYYLANAYYHSNQFEKAIEAYSKAIEYSKVNGESFNLVWSYYFNKANSLAKLNKNKESIVYYTQAIERNPNNANIYFNRGMNYLITQEKELAKRDWIKASNLGMKGVDEYIEEYFK